MVGGTRRPDLRTATAAGAAAVLLLSIGAVAGRAGRHEGSDRVASTPLAPVVTAPSRSVAPTPTPTPTATGPSDTASLASLVLPSPAGFLRTFDAPLPLATLAKQFAQPTQVSGNLMTDGYQQGLEIAYATPSVALDVQLWRFTSDTGATDFDDGYRLSNEPGTVISAVAPAAGTPGGYLFTFAKPDDKGYGSVVGVAVRGRIMIRIRYGQADGVHTAAPLAGELRAEYDRLPVGGTAA